MEKKEEPIRKETVIDEEQPQARRGPGRPRGTARSAWTKENSFHTTLVFDTAQYDRISGIAWEKRLSIKETMKRIIALGLERYDELESEVGEEASVSGK